MTSNDVSTAVPQKLLKIGELQAASGVTIKTIRYYEELGLIYSQRRTDGGFRLFSRQVIPRLSFIRRAQRLGFSLQEIHHILDIHDRGQLPCADVRDSVETKIEDIEQQIHQLRTLQAELRSLIEATADSSKRQQGIICPILQKE